ncbi:hypothetical protein J6590_037702 [Homalodisca vitripennis]|nr:hypothetical protein J6590_037702 [Homalodisca vitripennis]
MIQFGGVTLELWELKTNGTLSKLTTRSDSAWTVGELTLVRQSVTLSGEVEAGQDSRHYTSSAESLPKPVMELCEQRTQKSRIRTEVNHPERQCVAGGGADTCEARTQKSRIRIEVNHPERHCVDCGGADTCEAVSYTEWRG